MKADVSIKWRSERAADRPLVEEAVACVSERSPEVCPWQERFSLRLSDDEEHRSASCSRLTEARSEQQLSGQPRSLFLSVSKDAVCLCLKSGAVSDFHADVRLEQAGDFWGFLLLCWFVDSNIKAGQQHEPSSEKTQWKQRHLLDTYCGHMWWCRCCSLLSHF